MNDPHVNEDNLKDVVSKFFAICQPIGVHIPKSIPSLLSWKLYKADVTTAILQNGTPSRVVFVKQPN